MLSISDGLFVKGVNDPPYMYLQWPSKSHGATSAHDVERADEMLTADDVAIIALISWSLACYRRFDCE